MLQERLDSILAHMARTGLEQIIISSPFSIYYLTGQLIDPHERLLVLYLNKKGRLHFFANEIFGLAPSDAYDLTLHSDSDNPLRDLASTVAAGKIGIDKFWYSKFLIELLELRPDLQPVHGSEGPDLARQTKDPSERARMRYSSHLNDHVMARTIESLQKSSTESAVAAWINDYYHKIEADQIGVQVVCFGANGADPHHLPDQTLIKEGDSVVIDIFASFDNYWADMTRTVFYKEAGPKQRQVYELVRQANLAAIAAVKPGRKLSDLDRIAREIISEGGYGPYFIHRLGHGIGLECHEPPDVSAASDTIIEEGMAFSIEPGIYLPGEFGVRIEDLVLVTADGCEVINKYPKDLIVLD